MYITYMYIVVTSCAHISFLSLAAWSSSITFLDGILELLR